MALSQRSRVAIYTGLRKVVDEAAVVELLSCFPDDDEQRQPGSGGLRRPGPVAVMSERLAQVEARLARIESKIETLAAETGDGFTGVEEVLLEVLRSAAAPTAENGRRERPGARWGRPTTRGARGGGRGAW